MKSKTLALILLLTAMSGLAAVMLHGNLHPFGIGSVSQPAIPKARALEDYQTLEDARIMHWLCLIEQSGAGKRLDADFVKPLFDDATTQKLAVEAVEAVEATPAQFGELDQTVRICARILRVPKPKVFVRLHASLPTTIENYADPIIVVEADALHQSKDPRELRFVVGREVAHIAAHHVRWISLLRHTKPTVENNGVLGKAAAATLQASLWKWVGECQITSDQGDLICSQDIRASERAPVKLATGFGDAEMAAVSIDECATQSAPRDPTPSSGLMVVLQATHTRADTIPARVRQLREYQKSSGYRAIWKQ